MSLLERSSRKDIPSIHGITPFVEFNPELTVVNNVLGIPLPDAYTSDGLILHHPLTGEKVKGVTYSLEGKAALLFQNIINTSEYRALQRVYAPSIWEEQMPQTEKCSWDDDMKNRVEVQYLKNRLLVIDANINNILQELSGHNKNPTIVFISPEMRYNIRREEVTELKVLKLNAEQRLWAYHAERYDAITHEEYQTLMDDIVERVYHLSSVA